MGQRVNPNMAICPKTDGVGEHNFVDGGLRNGYQTCGVCQHAVDYDELIPPKNGSPPSFSGPASERGTGVSGTFHHYAKKHPLTKHLYGKD